MDHESNGVERINGFKIRLNTMPTSELLSLEGQIVDRLERTEAELRIVQGYLGLRALHEGQDGRQQP